MRESTSMHLMQEIGLIFALIDAAEQVYRFSISIWQLGSGVIFAVRNIDCPVRIERGRTPSQTGVVTSGEHVTSHYLKCISQQSTELDFAITGDVRAGRGVAGSILRNGGLEDEIPVLSFKLAGEKNDEMIEDYYLHKFQRDIEVLGNPLSLFLILFTGAISSLFLFRPITHVHSNNFMPSFFEQICSH